MELPCVSPPVPLPLPLQRTHFNETLSTLQFAQRAKLVVNVVAPALSIVVPPPPPPPQPSLPPRALTYGPGAGAPALSAGPMAAFPLCRPAGGVLGAPFTPSLAELSVAAPTEEVDRKSVV